MGAQMGTITFAIQTKCGLDGEKDNCLGRKDNCGLKNVSYIQDFWNCNFKS